MLSEIFIEISWQLTKPIESAPKAKDLCTLALFETTRLMDIDFLFQGITAMYKGSCYVTLKLLET
jgi:hypothetical protein